MSWSDKLTPGTPVHRIVTSQNTRIRVIAGPGTGKSFAVKRRVARLLENNIAPNTILPVTFTRVAAENLHRELIDMGVPGCDRLKGVTLHSLALQILMRNHVLSATGRTPHPLNDFELESLVCDLNWKKPRRGKEKIKDLIQAYEADDLSDQAFENELLSWLKFHKTMLIGEVIRQLGRYLYSNPAATERREYRHILVDEYQDLNPVEQNVIELLSDAAEVCIVGDDDQSIYSFRHAHPDGIREWSKTNKNVDDISLNECHRCPTRVVKMANKLISHNTQWITRQPLNPKTSNGEGNVQIIQYRNNSQEITGVAELVSQMISNGTPAGDILVLTQSRKAFGIPLYELLTKKNVPTKSYYAEVELSYEDAQKAFALLKLFVNREDRVALRWLVGMNKSEWYAGSYRRIRQHCEETGMSPWEVMTQLENGTLRIPYTNRIITSFRDIAQIIDNLESLPDLRSVIDQLFPDGQDSTRDIRELAKSILNSMSTDDRKELGRELSTAINQPEIPDKIQEVRIMSLYKSKGLSAPVTIIVGCAQGLLPRSANDRLTDIKKTQHLEEQRRLFYVGITRVKAVPEEGKPGTLILTSSMQMPGGEALPSGITPAGWRGGLALLKASQFICELGPSAPEPIVR